MEPDGDTIGDDELFGNPVIPAKPARPRECNRAFRGFDHLPVHVDD